MDFSLTPELAALRQEVRTFMEALVIPREDDVIREDAAGEEGALRELQEAAKQEGLFVPHLPAEYGGRGLGILGMCTLFREMGRSPVGARVFNCDAPDQGNMDLLLHRASPGLRERWLGPLARAEITSAFCMTEPAPGAGADPSNLRTRAVREGGGWRIDGHKWYSTGGGRASFLIVMARTSDDPRTGATLFVVDRHAPGVTHVRDIRTLAPDLLAHREAEFHLEGVRVGEEAVLGKEGEGFALAQARLIPARLTHCMRWLGLADRTVELCRSYLTTRVSFGRLLAEHQAMQAMLFEAATAIHAGNLMTWHCAWLLAQDRTKEARPYASLAKTHVARTLCQVLDNAIQMHGARGYSEDLPFALWYRSARAARIADGPDEVHLGVVARDYLSGRLPLLV
ncbi:MAG TPA: acyl-CoA dehydrogenase family protein [Myxococcaceae bacterium]|nr:acyl-CoA dehydrogenase family protein [Myxococcaceae bacterium]